MSEKVFEESNLDSALAKASGELNISVEDLNYRILEADPKAGFISIAVETSKAQDDKKSSSKPERKKERRVPKTNRNSRNDSSSETAPVKASPKIEEPAEPLTEENVEAIEKLLTGLKDVFPAQFESKVEANLKESKVNINFTVENEKFYLGNGEDVLASVEFLLNRMINKKISKYCSVVLDVNNSRIRKKEQMQELVKSLEEKVAALKKPITIKGMSSFERKIIHQYFVDHTAISTSSDGTDNNRYIVIEPSKAP